MLYIGVGPPYVFGKGLKRGRARQSRSAASDRTAWRARPDCSGLAAPGAKTGLPEPIWLNPVAPRASLTPIPARILIASRSGAGPEKRGHHHCLLRVGKKHRKGQNVGQDPRSPNDSRRLHIASLRQRGITAFGTGDHGHPLFRQLHREKPDILRNPPEYALVRGEEIAHADQFCRCPLREMTARIDSRRDRFKDRAPI
ncbi:hypothetical protein SAMN05519105_2334 [Rhodobacter sp. 24-YEA-8]|nr:hypothetical protein SAMN05519105_2334 [Rhodobacter sp. 24-YEA-8]